MPGFHNAHFLIPEILWRQLQKRARDTNRPMTALLNDAIQRYLKTSPCASKKPTPKKKRAGKPTPTQ